MKNHADYDLQEHPSDTTCRLKVLGVWPDANRLLRKVKQRFRNQAARSGGTMTTAQRLEMTKAAWDAVHQNWPPPPGTATLASLRQYLATKRGTTAAGKSGPTKLPPEADRRFDQIGEPDNLDEDVVWVYHRLDDANIEPQDAPSRGAWSMLLNARADRHRFYEKVYLPVVRDISRRKARNGAADKPQKPDQQELMQQEQIREMIRAAVAASQRMAL